MTADKCCGSCRWAQEFEYTKHTPPRLKHASGRCSAPINLDTSGIPSCVYLPGGLMSYLERSRHFIWPDQGQDCSVYERRPADE